MMEAITPTSPKGLAIRDKRSIREFTFPQAMRDVVYRESAYLWSDQELLDCIKAEFPEPHPSIRTVQSWRQDARREFDQERLRVVSKVLHQSADRAVKDAVGVLYGATLSAYAAMEKARESGNVKLWIAATRAAAECSDKLLNQFRGGAAEGESPVEAVIQRDRAVAKMFASGKFETMEQAYATFDAIVEGTAEAVEEQAMAEGTGTE